MDWIQIIVLSLIQGLTEFLPISSSGHLLLPSLLLDWQDQGLAFDVAVHVGTLTAVVLYFRKDVIALCSGWARFAMHRDDSPENQMAWHVIWATVPAIVFGLLMSGVIEDHLRSLETIIVTTILFGLVLWFADWFSRRQSSHRQQITRKAAWAIGFAQALALIPGTSRSGITMTCALLLGYDRTTAARFSFLISIPAIGAAGSYKMLELVQLGMAAPWGDVIAGAVIAGVSAYLCIHWFLKWIERISLVPFAIYRLLLGAVLIAVYLA